MSSNSTKQLIEIISSFSAGCGIMFMTASYWLMTPEDMLRWREDYSKTNEEKVDQALANPSQQMQEIRRKLNEATKLANEKDIRTFEERKSLQKALKILKTDKESLISELEEARTNSLAMKEQIEIYLDENNYLNSKISNLESKLVAVHNGGSFSFDPNLKGKSAYIYFIDANSKIANKLKILLESFGAKTKLKMATQKGASSNILYYEEKKNISLAANLQEAVGPNFGIKDIKYKDWPNWDMDFTFFITEPPVHNSRNFRR